MAINQITTANTFQQWLTSSQSLISFANDLTDGGNSFTFLANTNIKIGGDLTVSGNIILDAISFDDINSNGSASFANNLTVLGTSNLNTITSTTGLLTVNSNLLVNGFGFSAPTIRIKLTQDAVVDSPTPKIAIASPKKMVTIICVKGKLSKKVTALKPVCPTGYKKK